MTKRYDETIDVVADSLDERSPVAFSWRGHRYYVDQHLTSWRDAGEWWNGARAKEHEYHRVLAHPETALATGELDADGFMQTAGAVYDLYRDRLNGGWRLARIWD